MSDKNPISDYVNKNGRKLSPDEGNVIVKAVKAIVDVIVMVSGGKSSFGNKK